MDKITASSFSTGLKILSFIVPMFISTVTTAVVYSFSAGKIIQKSENLRKDFEAEKENQKQLWKERDVEFKKDHETIVRIDENVKFIKQAIRDLQ